MPHEENKGPNTFRCPQVTHYCQGEHSSRGRGKRCEASGAGEGVGSGVRGHGGHREVGEGSGRNCWVLWEDTMSWMDRRGMWGGVRGEVLREAGTLATQDDASTVSLVGVPCACLQSRSVMTHEFASSASRMCASQCTPSNSCALGFRSVPLAGGCVLWRLAGRVRFMVREGDSEDDAEPLAGCPMHRGWCWLFLFPVDPSAYPNWTLLEPLRDPRHS